MGFFIYEKERGGKDELIEREKSGIILAVFNIMEERLL